MTQSQRGEEKGEGADSGERKILSCFTPAATLFSSPQQSCRVFNSNFYKRDSMEGRL